MIKCRSIAAYLSLVLFGLIGFSTVASADNRDELIFFFNDAQGSAVAAINESGELCWDEVYTPYGDKTINDDVVSITGCGIVGEERGFTGHTEDVNSDLVYMQQRYYDPSIGRFLSIDPRKADPDNPNTYNRYAYANNNPYKYTDPDGEIPVLIWAGYVGVTAAITAYDSYRAYQNGGAAGLGKEIATNAAMSMVPGGKIGGKAAGIASNALGASKKTDVAKSVDTVSDTSRQALRKAKEANGIPKSAQPDRTIKPNTPEGNQLGLDGRNVKQFEYTSSSGQKISIRQDKAAGYGQGSAGDQKTHFNAGSAGQKLRQHHYYGD